MKLHLPLSLRKSLLIIFASTTIPTWGGGIHSDIDKRTYADFGQNKGRYRVTGVSSMLQAIRDKDGGIAIPKADGEITWVIPGAQGMINFAGSLDYGANGIQCHGAAAAFGANYLVTVAHNPGFSASFGTTQLGNERTIKYNTVAVTEKDMVSAADWALYRQNKIFTDVVGAYNYSGVSSEQQDSNTNGIPDIKEQLEGELMYRAFAGNVKVWQKDGSLVDAGSPYTTILGGISTIRAIDITAEGLIFGGWNMKSNSSWVNETAPLPSNGQGGDSGSPVYVYNKEAGRYEYIFSQRAGNFTTYSVAHGSIDFANEILATHSVAVDMSTANTTYLNSVSSGSGSIELDDTSISHLAVNSGSNTWKNLDAIKNNDNWYAYGNNYQNGISGLGSTQNLIFTGSGSNNSHNVILNATVDTGVGYLEFSSGQFTIKNADGGDYTLNTAGFIINNGADVHVQLTNPSDYMREWRKNGEGDLYIEGEGDNNILLTVGGSGSTYLSRGNGHAAYNVLASSGATVVIKDKNQIERDFTFGFNGGTLDMNGVSMDWFTTNNDIEAEDFSINALTDDAVITNSSGNTTLTYTQSGNSVWKGSLKDTTAGSLSIVANMGEGAEWTLNSICTDLSNNEASSFTVKSGTVVLRGVNTEHATGSVPYSDDIFFSEDDWHYADAKMNVTVENGALFRLGTHARLKGDITVDTGATYVMNEGVHHRMEYIEGGVIKEDTSEWAEYYGHHGDTNLAGGALKVEFSDKTTATHTYGGNITGNGSVTVDAANSILELTGNNNFTGSRSVISGTLMVEDAIAAGNEKWLVGEKGVFAAKNADGSTALSYIDSSSNGVLALSQDQNSQVSTAGHTNLIIGALSGQTIQYGAENTTETLAAVDKVWRLGGGGGNLVVNYHLSGDNTLILGNAHAKGVVTITNPLNDFTGGIDFAGAGVTLEYTDEAAIKNVTMNLRYGNRIAMADLLSNVTTDSDGILLLNRDDQDIDLTKHQTLALSAKGDMNHSGQITIADNQAYRFSAADGTFTVTTELGGNHNIIVDAQGYTGGTVQLNNLNNFTGDITVMGYDSSQPTITSGNITLGVSQDNVLNSAGTITVESGSTLNIGSTTQKFSNLVLQEGSSLIGNYRESNADPIASEIHLTIDSFSDIKGSISVESIHKYGDSTLELTNTLTTDGNIQYRYLTIEEGDVKLAAQNASVGNLNIRDNTLFLNGNTLMMGTVTAEDGAVIDATSTGSAIGGFSSVIATSGTVIMKNGGNDVTLAGIVGASNGATMKLGGSGNWKLASYSYNTISGILRIEDATQLDFSFGDNSYGSDAYYSKFEAVRGILDLDTGITVLQAAANTATQHMSFDTIKLNGQNLTLKEQNTSATWLIGNLDSGETTGSVLTWDASKSHTVTYLDRTGDAKYVTVTNSSRLILNGDNNFTGSIVAKRSANGAGYSTFVELAHNNALKNATLDMQSISGSTIALAVNTDNASIKGLTGDENSYAYSGASSDIKLDSAPTGDGKNTLTITGSGTYDYKGAVNGLNLAMAGSGTQKFSGSNIQAQNISALAGRMEFTNAPTVADTISIAQGATLKLGDSYSLNEGVTLAMIAGQSGTQGTLEGNLVLNGGTLQFDSTVLNAAASLLSANISFGDSFTDQAISFSNTDALELGATYTLLSGDWSGKTAALADSMPDYLSGSQFTANSNGLTVLIRLADSFSEWQDDHDVFATGNTVLFRDEDPSKALSFSQPTTADGMKFVNNETYVFSGSDVTLTNSLNMESGKLVLNNTLTAADLTATGGEVELGANGVLELADTQDSTATVNNISGTGTLKLKLDTTGSTYSNTLAVDADFEGTTHVTAGNLTLTGSTFGNTLKLAGGSNAQITAATTIDGNLELEGSSEIHQNSGNTLTINGSVSGNGGTWVRKGGGTLHLNGSVNLAGFDTGSDNTTSNFNGSTNITTVTLDQSNITANFNGNATVDTLHPTGTNVTIGGTGKLNVGNFNLAAGKSVTIDELNISETSAQTRSWNNNTVNLKNGAVLDSRQAYYNHASGTLTIGGSEADGTMYMKGLCLMPSDAQYATSVLNVSEGAHLIIAGDTAGTTGSDFVLAVGGEKSQLTSGSNKINISGTLTSNADMTLYYKSADVTVSNGGRLNLLGGLELKGTAYNNWVSGGVKGNLSVQEGGKLYAAGGTNRSEFVVSFAADSTLGAIGAAGSTVTFKNNMTLGTAGTDGTITIDTAATTADENLLLTRSEDKGVTVDMTGNLSMQGNVAVDIIGSGTLKHKSAFNSATAIHVQEGATLAVDSTAELTAATALNKSALALDSATVSGVGVSITDSATIRATGGSSTISANTTLTNESAITYDIAQGAELKSTGALTADSSRGSLIKKGAGSLQLNGEANVLGNIKVDAGELSVHGAAAYDLNDLEAATSADLSFYAGAIGEESAEAEVRVSGAANFGAGAVLNANLTLTTGSSLEVADGGLKMGSTLTLQEGLTLGDSTLARVRSLSAGQSTTLFSGVDGLTLGNKEYTTITENDSILAMPYFSNLDSSNYVLTYTGTDNGSLNITMVTASVPEPTSSMLGLMGLVAFTLRRRRK
ncbi:MAG: PEP-CTERM sorting domain-containing protein [Akkermansia sp.]|nr:PEP-CTERM sorting domain-containing protein [Akkermansia sp.]